MDSEAGRRRGRDQSDRPVAEGSVDDRHAVSGHAGRNIKPIKVAHVKTRTKHDALPKVVLTINAGSSSLKFAAFARDETGVAIMRGQVSELGAAPHLHARKQDGAVLADRRWPDGGSTSFDEVLQALVALVEREAGRGTLAAVGHRIVHGGADHVGPERVTPALMEKLRALVPLDPLHMPHNIAPIDAVTSAYPLILQVACFDTAFHHTLPPVARRTGLPRAFEVQGVRRYGFHGLSYEYISGRLRQDAPALASGRVVVAHLGAGASLCGLRQGRSVATTMGFSSLDGLLMATRCGNLDPGIILYLARAGHTPGDIEDILYVQSGLLGVSGISGDIRDLLADADPHAAAAVDLFTYRIATELAATVCALGGVDGIVFTAGIGENSSVVRAAVCARLAWLGVQLDPTANVDHAAVISERHSRVEVRVMATDEEAMIARHTHSLLEIAGAP